VKISIASGKGGTGKTTFSVNLAWALASAGHRVQLLDGDVEEPNAHLFVQPTFTEERDVKVRKPVWDAEKCTGCGICAKACTYNALAVVKGKVLIFNELCHACGVCSQVCPEGALREEPFVMGKVRMAPDCGAFFFADGLLNVGEASAPTVVKELKRSIDLEAISILDAAPGTGCPVVEAVDGADVAILVTEPTPFGLHDLQLAIGLTLKMGVPTGLVINRSDGHDPLIAEYAEAIGVPIVGRILFERKYAEAYSRGEVLADVFPELRQNMLAIYEQIKPLAGTVAPPVPVSSALEVGAQRLIKYEKGESDSFQELAVISGKGGTGKTTITASLIQLAEQVVLADNDVDAADLHLLLNPRVCESHDFCGGLKAEIDSTTCIGCGVCANACHFDAINVHAAQPSVYRVDDLACEGCSLCKHVCPVDAVTMRDVFTGKWYVSETPCGPMVHAALGIAEENSGKLVTQVRKHAAEQAQDLRYERIIADGPPGTSCPVIASISGVDRVLIVTEPTVSGVHDLKRVLELCRHFGVPAAVAINKADLNGEQVQRIHQMATEMDTLVVGEIPFDRTVHNALMDGKTILDYARNSPAAQAILALWDNIKNGRK
jgi:MinD superfamily P-loop ATPase